MELITTTQRRTPPFEHYSSSDGLNRLLCAAIVDRGFCQRFLADPAAAVQAGYLGESFALSDDEMIWIQSVRAATLSEFAGRLLDLWFEKGFG